MNGSYFQAIWNGLMVLATGLQALLLLAIRLIFGYKFFIAGLGKFGHIASIVSFFEELGIPLPAWNAYFVSSAECIGGILLILGLCTRPTAFLLTIIMIVAFLTAHLNAVKEIFSNPVNFVHEGAFNYLLASLILFAFGPGKISVDHFLGRWFFRVK